MTDTTTTSSLASHWNLDPDVLFLNHGSFGACPRAVLEAQAQLRAELEREPVLFMAREIADRIDAARERAARFVGASPEDVVFVPNATTGVNAVLRSLELAPGDELLLTNHQYNACHNAAEYVCERAGAQVVVADVPFPVSSEDQVVEAILERVSPKTRLALLDHITSPTGIVFPIERLVRELRERGVETLVDGAHGPGMVKLELDALGAAYYTGNFHKWVCAPKGAGFLFVRRELQDGVRPTVISHGANSPRPGHSRFQDEFDWVGTDDPTPYLSVPHAIEYVASLVPGGWDEIRARNHALVLEARDALCAELEFEAPSPDAMSGSLVSLRLADGDPDTPTGAFVVDPEQGVLFDQHRVEVPIMTWPKAPIRLMRISAHLYNHIDQYRTLAHALASMRD